MSNMRTIVSQAFNSSQNFSLKLVFYVFNSSIFELSIFTICSNLHIRKAPRPLKEH